jgi:hypothetical protein
MTDDFGGMLTRHTNTSNFRPKMGISVTERVRFGRTRAVYSNILRLQDHNMICLEGELLGEMLSIYGIWF